MNNLEIRRYQQSFKVRFLMLATEQSNKQWNKSPGVSAFHLWITYIRDPVYYQSATYCVAHQTVPIDMSLAFSSFQLLFWGEIYPLWYIRKDFRILQDDIQDVRPNDIHRLIIVNAVSILHRQTVEQAINSYRCKPVQGELFPPFWNSEMLPNK